MMDAKCPQIILILSGKRKSGKDYIAELLQERLGTDDTVIIRLSGPLKQQYAKENNLNYEKLLDASEYKEIHRREMILWGEEKRNSDPGYFCRWAIEQNEAWTKSIWIVSDARRATDIQYFKENFKKSVKTIRVEASDDVKKSRGWCYTRGIDDAESECGLDSYTNWDYSISNEGNSHELESFICTVKQTFLTC